MNEKKTESFSLPVPEDLSQQPHSPLLQSTKRLAIKPLKGMMFNPLRTLPRNMRCPCRSGLKFKKCCLSTLPLVVPEDVGEQWQDTMSKPDLVFMNKDNSANIAAEIVERSRATNEPGKFE